MITISHAGIYYSQVVVIEQNFCSTMQISKHQQLFFVFPSFELLTCLPNITGNYATEHHLYKPTRIRRVQFTSIINLFGGYGGTASGRISRMGQVGTGVEVWSALLSHRKSRLSILSNSGHGQFKLSEANMAQQYK